MFSHTDVDALNLQWLRDSEKEHFHLRALYFLSDVHCWFVYTRTGLCDTHDSWYSQSASVIASVENVTEKPSFKNLCHVVSAGAFQFVFKITGTLSIIIASIPPVFYIII